MTFSNTKKIWQNSMMNLHHLASVFTIFYQICFTYVSPIPAQEYIKADLKYQIMSTVKTSEYIASKYGLFKNITIWLSYMIRLVIFNIAWYPMFHFLQVSKHVFCKVGLNGGLRYMHVFPTLLSNSQQTLNGCPGNLTQFWHYLAGDSIRPHRVRAQSHFRCQLQVQVATCAPVWLAIHWRFPQQPPQVRLLC